MDINGKADPYLVLQLGSKRVSGRAQSIYVAAKLQDCYCFFVQRANVGKIWLNRHFNRILSDRTFMFHQVLSYLRQNDIFAEHVIRKFLSCH
jgi:hypothetical protein